MRLKVTGMPNLHAGAFPELFEGEGQLSGVEFLLLDRIAKVYTYEDHPGGCSGGSFPLRRPDHRRRRGGVPRLGLPGDPRGHVGIRAVVRRARHQMREHVVVEQCQNRHHGAVRGDRRTARTMSRRAALAPREGCRATPWTG